MFEKVCAVMDESQIQLDQFLMDEFERYFLEMGTGTGGLIRNPFCTAFNASIIPDEIQEEFLNLKNDSLARDLFKKKLVTNFGCAIYQSYSKASLTALRIFVSFASNYVCEAGFSTLVDIKTSNVNRLDAWDDMRLALTNP
ncbi:zinc finger BED domain-containing protein 5-like [Palaemon carinicauda]|uniref:zinc finger BED domain-containing protein 5-like n=1 Tax=Palaemon carinicauda TaxID=392227 RepID=UPI0035B59983